MELVADIVQRVRCYGRTIYPPFKNIFSLPTALKVNNSNVYINRNIKKNHTANEVFRMTTWFEFPLALTYYFQYSTGSLKNKNNKNITHSIVCHTEENPCVCMCHSVRMKERERERKCLLTLTHIFPHIYRPQRVMGDVHASYLINAGSFISGLHPKKLWNTNRNWINENYCR